MKEANQESLKAAKEATDAQLLVDEISVEREALEKKIEEQVHTISALRKDVEGAAEKSFWVVKEMADARYFADEIKLDPEGLQKKIEEQFETISQLKTELE